MYEDRYDLTEDERSEVRQVLAEMALRGGRLADAHGRPIPHRILRGRRFMVCPKGLVWRYAPEGSAQPGQDPRGLSPSGSPRRNSAVEMWTGKWRRALTPDGRATHAKCLIWVPLDEHINGRQNIPKLGWYRSEKGFRHPLEAPHEPSEEQVAALESRRAMLRNDISARMRQEGLRGGDVAARPGQEAAAAHAVVATPTAPPIQLDGEAAAPAGHALARTPHEGRSLLARAGDTNAGSGDPPRLGGTPGAGVSGAADQVTTADQAPADDEGPISGGPPAARRIIRTASGGCAGRAGRRGS